jgi:hypothetical protein
MPDRSADDRLKDASPKELRQLATELLRGQHPELLRQSELVEGTVDARPGPGDGGTLSSPPSRVDLQHEQNPVRVREEARRIREGRR